jgi:hypothetical protein
MDKDLKRHKDKKLLKSFKDITKLMHGEGLYYTFKGNLNFEDVEDKEFHKLRKYLIQHIDLMDFYLKKTINGLEERIEKYDEE